MVLFAPGTAHPEDVGGGLPVATDALALAGMRRADLGWWSRFPADIPYKLRHFDDLFAEPLATVTLHGPWAMGSSAPMDPRTTAVPFVVSSWRFDSGDTQRLEPADPGRQP